MSFYFFKIKANLFDTYDGEKYDLRDTTGQFDVNH